MKSCGNWGRVSEPDVAARWAVAPRDLDVDFTSVSVEAAFDALGLVAAVLPEVLSLTAIGGHQPGGPA